jgi:hypothetical protein
VTSAFAVVGPDAFMSGWVWHPSLYTGAMALLLAGGIRLRSGSRWWAAVIVAIPGAYALMHYSGFVLYGAAAVALLASRRPRDLWLPIVAGVAVSALAWAPFLVFEAHHHWSDFHTISNSADPAQSLEARVRERASGTRFAFRHLGQALHGPVLLTPVIVLLALAACIQALVRRTLTFPVAIGAGVVLAGVAAQVAANMALRTDVLMLWLLPLYLLAAWFVTQTRWPAVSAVAIVAILVLGSIDLSRAVADTAADHTLSAEWAAARAARPVRYDNASVINALYLPCDPPWGWGAETWYLQEVNRRGAGVAAAARANAWGSRTGVCYSRRA